MNPIIEQNRPNGVVAERTLGMGELVDGNAALSEQFFHVSIGQPVARGRPSGEVPLAWSCSRRPPPEPDMIVSDRPALR
jgi:hypothetical protein